MSPLRATAMKHLHDRIPQVTCLGKCAHACFDRIGMTRVEADQIRRAVTSPGGAVPQACPQLTTLRTCRVYAVRPVICRLWGVADALRCPHDCRPEQGWLSDADALEFLLSAYEIDGTEPYASLAAAIRRIIYDPAVQPLLRPLLRGDWSGAQQVAAAVERSGRRPSR